MPPADDPIGLLHRFNDTAVDFGPLWSVVEEVARHLLEGLFFGIKSAQEVIGQRERLLALGSLSAGLTHELNNPAAAAAGNLVAAGPGRRYAAQAGGYRVR